VHYSNVFSGDVELLRSRIRIKRLILVVQSRIFLLGDNIFIYHALFRPYNFRTFTLTNI